MARRQRDYAAEQRRRNELAQQRGFSSRAAQRRAIEKGNIPALAPNRIRSEKTRQAQQNVTRGNQAARPSAGGSRKDRITGAGFSSEYQYRKIRGQVDDWSALHGGREVAQYLPEVNAPGVDRYTYTMAYYRAFVSGPERHKAVRYEGGSEALRHYLVDITHHYTADEYEVAYGTQND